MRILEAQNAVLTNVEVYTFLSNQAKEYQSQKRRGPNSLEALRGEVRRSSSNHCLLSSQRAVQLTMMRRCSSISRHSLAL